MNQEWKPVLDLKRYFVPTRFDKYGEIRKAKIKNHNLPILQMLYNGDPLAPLKCLMTNREGWVDFPCIVTKNKKQRFDIDFNHIRQRQAGKCVAGNSVDKAKGDPSHIFRYVRLDSSPLDLIEFMTIMPVCQEYHRYITQDSAIGHITLANFPKKYWPWFLKSKRNFNKICKMYNLPLEYEWFLDHLSNIDHPPITTRVNIP